MFKRRCLAEPSDINKVTNELLLVRVGDRVKYVPDPDNQDDYRLGEVVEVIEWTGGRRGRTMRVVYDNGNVGEFRSDSDRGYLFRI